MIKGIAICQHCLTFNCDVCTEHWHCAFVRKQAFDPEMYPCFAEAESIRNERLSHYESFICGFRIALVMAGERSARLIGLRKCLNMADAGQLRLGSRKPTGA